MKIYGNLFDPIRPDRAGGANPASPHSVDAPAQPVAPAAPVAPRTDSVEISSQGRSLSEATSVDPERVAEMRRKVYEGAYNSLDLVDQVARRILHRGDL